MRVVVFISDLSNSSYINMARNLHNRLMAGGDKLVIIGLNCKDCENNHPFNIFPATMYEIVPMMFQIKRIIKIEATIVALDILSQEKLSYQLGMFFNVPYAAIFPINSDWEAPLIRMREVLRELPQMHENLKHLITEIGKYDGDCICI